MDQFKNYTSLTRSLVMQFNPQVEAVPRRQYHSDGSSRWQNELAVHWDTE